MTSTATDWPNGNTSPLCVPLAIEQVTLTHQTDLGLQSGWVSSGVDSGPEYTLDPTTPDDVDITKNSAELSVIVRPSVGRFRIAGWHNSSILSMDAIGHDNIVRGKFYIYASNPSTDPVNKVPNFRIRLENEGAVLASCSYAYSQTGNGGGELDTREPFYQALNNPAAEERAGVSLRPSGQELKPSLYRLDFFPVDTPSVADSNLGATFESYASQAPADGTLSLTELTTAIYPLEVSEASEQTLYVYHNYSPLDNQIVSNTPWEITQGGQFNVENDFQAGRLQTLDIPGEVPDSSLAIVDDTALHHGTVIDTTNVPTDRFGVGIWTLRSNDFTQTPRIEPNKIYLASFVVSSDLPTSSTDPGTTVQSGMSFQIQTGLGAVTSRLELAGPVNASTPDSAAKRITGEALPGIGCQNERPFLDLPGPVEDAFLSGEDGGVYNVVMSTPMDPDIRPDTNGDLGALANEPGPGVDADSARDISIGINVISQPETLRLSPSLLLPWDQPNVAKVRMLMVTLSSFNQVDDGGYGY